MESYSRLSGILGTYEVLYLQTQGREMITFLENEEVKAYNQARTQLAKLFAGAVSRLALVLKRYEINGTIGKPDASIEYWYQLHASDNEIREQNLSYTTIVDEVLIHTTNSVNGVQVEYRTPEGAKVSELDLSRAIDKDLKER